jgi:hypothetical protein
MGRKEISPEYLKKLRKIQGEGEWVGSRAHPGHRWGKKVIIWNRGGWAKLAPHECEWINQRVERLRELLPEEEHQTQLDAFYLGVKGEKMYGYIGYLNKNLWELLLRLEKIASEQDLKL